MPYCSESVIYYSQLHKLTNAYTKMVAKEAHRLLQHPNILNIYNSKLEQKLNKQI